MGWLQKLFSRLDVSGRQLAAVVCWAVWKARNELVWNQKILNVEDVAVLAKTELNQWKSAQDRDVFASLVVPYVGDGLERWVSPYVGMIKVNVDAAIFSDLEAFGFGCVARTAGGVFVEAIVARRAGPVSPEIAEAIGLKEALSWIKRKGWGRVLVETDCLVVVQSVRSQVHMPSYFGGIVSDCQLLLQELCQVDLRFVKRSANRVAHQLARASYFYADRIFCVGSVPPDIQNVLLDDLSA